MFPAQEKTASTGATQPSASPVVTTPSASGPAKDLRETSIYPNKSEFDILKALWLVTSRKNPKIHLGAIDMSCAFVVCDASMNDCPIIYVSDNSQNLTGYSSQDIVGQNCRFLQAPDGKVEAGTKREFVDDGAVFNLKRMVQQRKEVQQSLINYRKGGKPFLNLLTIIPIPWDTDEIRYFVGFQIDLVECPDAIAVSGFGGSAVNYKQSDISIWIPPSSGFWEADNGQTLGVEEVSTVQRQSNAKGIASDWHRQSLSARDSGYASLPIRGQKVQLQTAGKAPSAYVEGVDTGKRDPVSNEEYNTDDADSIYTMGSEASLPAKDAYISSLAEDLLSKSLLEWPDEGTLDSVCEALPRLLKTFAAKVGSSDSMQIYRDVMVFVRRYRSEIARVMKHKYLEEKSDRRDVLGENIDRIDIEDMIRNWNGDADAIPDPNATFNEQPDDAMEGVQDDDLDNTDPITEFLPECAVYRDFISKLPAYKWLVESVGRASYLSAPGDAQTNTREAILGCLPKAPTISRKIAPQRHRFSITAPWDPALFLREQEYQLTAERALERAITITGSKMEAQAATTAQYLSQTWPLSSQHFLNVVTQAVSSPPGVPSSECHDPF